MHKVQRLLPAVFEAALTPRFHCNSAAAQRVEKPTLGDYPLAKALLNERDNRRIRFNRLKPLLCKALRTF